MVGAYNKTESFAPEGTENKVMVVSLFSRLWGMGWWGTALHRKRGVKYAYKAPAAPWSVPHWGSDFSPAAYNDLSELLPCLSFTCCPDAYASFIVLPYEIKATENSTHRPYVLRGTRAWWMHAFKGCSRILSDFWMGGGSVYSLELCLFLDVLAFYVFPSSQNIPRRKVGHLIVLCHAKDSSWHTKGNQSTFVVPTHVVSSGPALWPEGHLALSLCLCSIFGSSHPPLPEGWWEDPFGGFQQLAAGWWEAPQDSPETEQFAERGWLHRTLPGLCPGGFHAQPPQSLFWPYPEPGVPWTEDIPEEAAGRNPQTILQGGKWASMAPGTKAYGKEDVLAHCCPVQCCVLESLGELQDIC